MPFTCFNWIVKGSLGAGQLLEGFIILSFEYVYVQHDQTGCYSPKKFCLDRHLQVSQQVDFHNSQRPQLLLF